MIEDGIALKRFELPEAWERDYELDPAWSMKHRIMEAMLPPDVHSVLDVGCGNGAQARLLANKRSVVALDASQLALQYAPAPRLRGWSHDLPFANNSFDAVWSSEMLEHLTDDSLQKTAIEMKRVTRRWVSISVPFRENLRYRKCRCHVCDYEFHVYGHLQTFDLIKLKQLFTPLSLTAWAVCGNLNEWYPSPLLFTREKLGRKWFSLPSAYPICPACGHEEQEIWYGNRIARWCDHVAEWYQQKLPKKQPYWLITLWKLPDND